MPPIDTISLILFIEEQSSYELQVAKYLSLLKKIMFAIHHTVYVFEHKLAAAMDDLDFANRVFVADNI